MMMMRITIVMGPECKRGVSRGRTRRRRRGKKKDSEG
jgi:hypothetical protein